MSDPTRDEDDRTTAAMDRREQARRDLAGGELRAPTLPTITVRQPFALALALGVKTVENRVWPAPRRLVGGELAIHAGAWWSDAGVRQLVTNWFRMGMWRGPAAEELSTVDAVFQACEEGRSAVLAVGVLDSVAGEDDLTPRAGEDAEAFARWRIPGNYGWRIRDVVRLARPEPAMGRERIWSLNIFADERVRAQLRARPPTRP